MVDLVIKACVVACLVQGKACNMYAYKDYYHRRTEPTGQGSLAPKFGTGSYVSMANRC